MHHLNKQEENTHQNTPIFVNTATHSFCKVEHWGTTSFVTLGTSPFQTLTCNICDNGSCQKEPWQTKCMFTLWREALSALKFVNFVTNTFLHMELLETDAWSHWRKDILRTRICKSCDKPFMSEGALRNHMLNHTGEKRVLGLVTSVKIGSCQKTLRNRKLRTLNWNICELETGAKYFKCCRCNFWALFQL